MRKYNNKSDILNENNLVYSVMREKTNAAKVSQLIITLSNFVIYQFKLKKFFNVTAEVNEHMISNNFISKLKFRILSDHKRLTYRDFIGLWDPGEPYINSSYNKDKINNWLFIGC